jgi:hypothetical protein
MTWGGFMFLRWYHPRPTLIPGTGGFIVRLVSAGISLVVLLICTGCFLPLAAKTDGSCGLKTPAGKTVPIPDKLCPKPKFGGNLADDVKSVFACAWLKPKSADSLLGALEILTSGPQTLDISKDANETVFERLRAASPDNADLFCAAMGEFGKYGPAVQGLPDLLDRLAKANTRSSEKDSPNYKSVLFDCAQDIIKNLYQADPIAVAKINDAFAQKSNYVGLYNLLRAMSEQKRSVEDLETIRAAFEVSEDNLASLVAAEMKSAK